MCTCWYFIPIYAPYVVFYPNIKRRRCRRRRILPDHYKQSLYLITRNSTWGAHRKCAGIPCCFAPLSHSAFAIRFSEYPPDVVGCWRDVARASKNSSLQSHTISCECVFAGLNDIRMQTMWCTRDPRGRRRSANMCMENVDKFIGHIYCWRDRRNQIVPSKKESGELAELCVFVRTFLDKRNA